MAHTRDGENSVLNLMAIGLKAQVDILTRRSDQEINAIVDSIVVETRKTVKWTSTMEYKLSELEKALRFGNHMRMNIEDCIKDIMKFKPRIVFSKLRRANQDSKAQFIKGSYNKQTKKPRTNSLNPIWEGKYTTNMSNGATPRTTNTTPSQQSSSVLGRISRKKNEEETTPTLEDIHLPNINGTTTRLDTSVEDPLMFTERLEEPTVNSTSDIKRNESQVLEENDPTFVNTTFLTENPTRSRSTSGDITQRNDEKEKDYVEREKELSSENERLQTINNYLQQLFQDLHEAIIQNTKKKRKIRNFISKPPESVAKEILVESCYSNAKEIGRLYIEKEREADYAWILIDDIAAFVNREDKNELTSQTFPKADIEKGQGEKLMAKFCVASMIIGRFKSLEAFSEKYTLLETSLKRVTEERNDIQFKYKADIEKEQEKRKKLAIKLRKVEKAKEELWEEHQIELQHVKLIEKQNEILTAENIIHKEQVHVLNRGYMANKENEGKLNANLPRPDLGDPNRPIGLGQQYSHVYGREWKDAFERLKEEGKGESAFNSIRNLLFILQDCYRYCREVRKNQMAKLKSLVFFPTQDPSLFQTTNVIEDVIGIVTADLGDASKHSSDVTWKSLAKEFQGLPDMVQKHGKALSLCIEYVEACIKVCWMMHLVDPPVSFEIRGKRGDKFDTTLYEPYVQSGKKLAFIVWPLLFLTEGGVLLAKGIAEGSK